MKRRQELGFTLLEVLIATVIMAIAVTGVLSALSTSLRNAGRLTDHDRAAMLARRKMDELLLEKRLPRQTMLEGVFDPPLTNGQPAGWKARVSVFELPPNPGPGSQVLDRVEVQVWWMASGNQRTFTLESFRRHVLTPQEVAGGALLTK